MSDKLAKPFLPLALAVILAASALWSPGRAAAQSAAFDAVRDRLYLGQTGAAVQQSRAALATDPDDHQMRFALGASQFILALEHLGQDLYRFGLDNSAGSQFGGLGMMPIVRFPVPLNADPEPITYQAFRGILQRFSTDLAMAESTLAQVPDGSIDLPLDIVRIHLDLDSDGVASETESLAAIMASIGGGNAPRAIAVDFDAADAVWLRGYSHILMAIIEFLLAHDWQEGFEATFHGLFPNSDLPGTAMLAERQKAAEQLSGMRRPEAPQKPADMDWQTWQQTDEYKEWQIESRRQRQIRQRAEWGGFADVIGFIHLLRWPVAEPERMASVLAHLESVSTLSRENWRRILAETDNRNEWVPGPSQSGGFGNVTKEQVESWMRLLDEYDAILAGRKLLPHWRFSGGINFRRMFTEPRTFDLVLMFQGSAALPYIESGELTDERTWRDITRAFGRDFLFYALWFN